MTSSLSTSQEIISAYLDAVSRKDPSVVERFFHPDVEYVVNGYAAPDQPADLAPISPECSTALPWLGCYRGHDAVRDFLEHMHRNLEITAFGPLEIIAEGNKGAAFGWFRLEAMSTRRSADISFAVNFELRDGLIAKYHFVENTMDVANAFHVDGVWTVATDDAERSVPALSVRSFTSSEPGAWANSYLIAGKSDAILYDVPMLKSDAIRLAQMIERSRKKLTTIVISHAHPDHFLSLEFIKERFPAARIVSTERVIADISSDGPWMLSVVQQRFGEDAAKDIVIPDLLERLQLDVEGEGLKVVEFAQGECKHLAALHAPALRALFCADLLYNKTHAYLQERHLESWLDQLDELESYTKRAVSIFYPGHGAAGGSELIEKTRTYLRDFRQAVGLGNAEAARQHMLSAYPDYHAVQFLTAFSIPAYFSGPNFALSAGENLSAR